MFQVTPDFLQLRISHHMEIAKKIVIERGPQDSHDGFNPDAIIIHNDGSEQVIPFPPWRDYQEKAAVCGALSDTCKVMSVSALIVKMNATYMDTARVAKEIGIHVPDSPDKFDYFEKRMTEWRRKMTKGTMYLPDLPPEYRFDGIAVTAMAPRIPEMGSFVLYRWEGGRVSFFQEKNTWQDAGDYRIENRMIPKWWD